MDGEPNTFLLFSEFTEVHAALMIDLEIKCFNTFIDPTSEMPKKVIFKILYR